MTTIFHLHPLWPKYPPFFFIFCYLERLCLYNREISLAILLRQNNKTNMTKNRDFCHIAHPYLELTSFVTALAQTALKSFSKISFVWKYCQVCKQPLTLKTDTKKRKYCSSLSKLNVHYAKYGREILNIELGVGVYMNVFLRGTNCFEKSLNYIFFSSCLCILHV